MKKLMDATFTGFADEDMVSQCDGSQIEYTWSETLVIFVVRVSDDSRDNDGHRVA